MKQYGHIWLQIMDCDTITLWMHNPDWQDQLVYLSGAWLCHSAYVHVRVEAM